MLESAGRQMRIGLDFDNTIVSYDRVFHLVAEERGLIPEGLPVTKLTVRDHLRAAAQEDIWTEMQGYVYGARMADAAPYPGALVTLRLLRDAGHELIIVSHKTRTPYRGPAYDLHKAAVDWIKTILRDEAGALIDPGNLYFLEKKEEKIASIGELSCDVFVDDLPEILLAEEFPPRTLRVLFDPDGNHGPHDAFVGARSWRDVGDLIASQAGVA